MALRTLSLYQVDAFTNRLFGGNPAGVVPLLEHTEWPSEALMQSIGLENNLSETAFLLPAKKGGEHDYHIRWFTPEVEVDLCGHATLGASFVVFQYLKHPSNKICLSSKSGNLYVKKEEAAGGEVWLTLDFPVDDLKLVEERNATTSNVISAIGLREDQVTEYYQGKTDIVLVVTSRSIVQSTSPNFNEVLKAAPSARGVIVTSAGDGSDDSDFCSRFFAPQTGVNEDPVTGSAHTTLTPLWTKKLGKEGSVLIARQISARGGLLKCRLVGDRVEISGQCVAYLEGKIVVPQ